MPYNGSNGAAAADIGTILEAHEDRMGRAESSIQQLIATTAVQGTKIDLLVGKLDKFVDSVEDKLENKEKNGSSLSLRVHDLETESKRRSSFSKTMTWIVGGIGVSVISDVVIHILTHLHILSGG